MGTGSKASVSEDDYVLWQPIDNPLYMMPLVKVYFQFYNLLYPLPIGHGALAMGVGVASMLSSRSRDKDLREPTTIEKGRQTDIFSRLIFVTMVITISIDINLAAQRLALGEDYEDVSNFECETETGITLISMMFHLH
jgi:hypothetical protein